MQGVSNRNRRICGTGNTHSLIYITTTGKGITDRTAKTGSGATERLDFRWVIVGFILKEYKPFLSHRTFAVVHFHRNNYRAGIDLIGFFHIIQLAVFFQFSHRHQSQIHQTNEFVISSGKNLFSCIQVTLVRGFNRGSVISIVKGYVF